MPLSLPGGVAFNTNDSPTMIGQKILDILRVVSGVGSGGLFPSANSLRGGTTTTILPANPNRVALFVPNQSTNPLTIYLGSSNAAFVLQGCTSTGNGTGGTFPNNVCPSGAYEGIVTCTGTGILWNVTELVIV